jgi:hypothetical protein
MPRRHTRRLRICLRPTRQSPTRRGRLRATADPPMERLHSADLRRATPHAPVPIPVFPILARARSTGLAVLI